MYEACLCHELDLARVAFLPQVRLPIVYKGHRNDTDLIIDVLAKQSLVLEIKAVSQILPLHEAQLLTCLRVSGSKAGLLLNSNEETLKQSIRRRML